MKRSQAAINTTPLAMVLNMKVRWNSWLKCLERTKHNLTAVAGMNVDLIHDTQILKNEWRTLLRNIEDSMYMIDVVVPIMKLTAQWTQVMSSNQCVTISLVRLMIRSLRKAVDDLVKNASIGNNEILVDIGKSFEKQIDNYYGDDIYL